MAQKCVLCAFARGITNKLLRVYLIHAAGPQGNRLREM
jgi:hypothetical protein